MMRCRRLALSRTTAALLLAALEPSGRDALVARRWSAARSSWFRDSVPRQRSRTAWRMAELDESH